jgi:hypothetical protein
MTNNLPFDAEINTDKDWQQCHADVFWGEIAPCNHVVQVYEDDAVFIDSLEGFVRSGILAEDCVIVIATAVHLKALEKRLKLHGFDKNELIESGRYIPLNAEKSLRNFMVTGWPDEKLFMKFVRSLIPDRNGRSIRAFGEMVAILWAQGYSGATVQLEHLWNKFCEMEELSLFCAYPKSGFTQDVNTSISHICSTHSKVIEGRKRAGTQISYKNVARSSPVDNIPTNL